MRFKLTMTEDEDGRSTPGTVTIEFSAETWMDVLPRLDQFLRACGYSPPQTELMYAEEEEG